MSAVRAGAAAADPIDRTVAELGRRLPAPLRPRRFLTEVRDGLSDAAEAYRRAGLPPAEAARRAVDDFGPIDDVVAASGDTTVGAFCRLAAYTQSFGYLLTMIGWLILGMMAPEAPAGMPNGPSPVTFWFGGLAAAAFIAGPLLTWHLRRGARRQRPAAATVPRLIATVVIFCGLTLISSYVVAPWRLDKWNPGYAWTPLDVTETVSGAIQLIIVATSVACLLVARRVRRAVGPPARPPSVDQARLIKKVC